MGIPPQISFGPKMRRVTIFLAFLAFANAEPDIQFQNNYNQVNPDQAAPREAQNFGDSLDSYGAPAGPVLDAGTTTYEVKGVPVNDAGGYTDAGFVPAGTGSWGVKGGASDAGTWQATGNDAGNWYTSNGPVEIVRDESTFIYPVQQQNNALGLPDWLYNGFILFLSILAIGQAFQLAKNIWALKLEFWDKTTGSGRSLDPATMDLIKNSIDQAALKFTDWIKEE